MNNLAYMSPLPEQVAPKVEELVREDLGATAPLPYRVQQSNAPGGVGALVGNVWSTLIGGTPTLLFSVTFDLTSPRRATLEVHLDRQGVGCRGGVIAFASPLAKRITGEVALENPKFFGKSKFTGDAAIAAKLNANGDLIKLANKVSRVETLIGGVTTTLARCLKVVPTANGAELVCLTLPRVTKMGIGATTDAADMLALATLVESVL